MLEKSPKKAIKNTYMHDELSNIIKRLKPKMTKHLEDCLKQVPKTGWFTSDDVMARIARPDYNLNRLVDNGKLESKVEIYGNFYQTKKIYRLIS